MLNRPAASWLTEDADQSRHWDPDRAPGLRLAMMWLAVLLPLVAVAARMAQLQVVLRDDFVSGFEQTYEALAEIPARHGRILAADGSEASCRHAVPLRRGRGLRAAGDHLVCGDCGAAQRDANFILLL